MTIPSLPPTSPPAIEGDLVVRPGQDGTVELVVLLTADGALDLALRIVGVVQAAKRAARP